MLRIAVLVILSLGLYLWLRDFFSKRLSRLVSGQLKFQQDYENLCSESLRVKSENEVLEKNAQESIALYDLTKEICKYLEEEKIFSVFHANIRKYLEIGDCRLIKPEEDISQYRDYSVLPLVMHKNTMGYLVAKGLSGSDVDKFHILAQQFLLAIKRSLLYKKVQELAILDGLTQIFSRRYFLTRFSEEFARCEKFKLKLSFLMVDIDRFKEFNDQYGHLVGDAILKEVAKVIKDNIRQIDFMGRYGGEELSIVLTETEAGSARLAAERIRQAVESKIIRAYDEDLKVTVSVGVSVYPQDAASVQELIESADDALYRAKQEGRNRVCSAATGS